MSSIGYFLLTIIIVAVCFRKKAGEVEDVSVLEKESSAKGVLVTLIMVLGIVFYGILTRVVGVWDAFAGVFLLLGVVHLMLGFVKGYDPWIYITDGQSYPK